MDAPTAAPPSLPVRDLDRKHATYDADDIAQREALYRGGRAWHDLASTWLPRGGVEPPALYQERICGAKYTNYLATVLDLITAQLFGKAPTLDTDEQDAEVDAAAADLATSADGARLGLPALARQFFTDALLHGRAWALVEQPATSAGDFASRADQENAGALAAYLRRFAPSAVINWRLDGSDVAWMVARESFDDQPDPFARPDAVIRWTVATRHLLAVYEWRKPIEGGNRPKPDDGDAATLLQAVAHGRTYDGTAPMCPVVLLELPAGLDAGGKLKDPAARLARSENELDWGLYRAANELLIVRSLDEPKVPTLGHGYYLHLGGENDEAYYVGPSGASLSILAERVDRLRVELYRVVQQMALAADPSASRAGASAASKAQDWTASDRLLTSYADELRDFLEEAVRQALSVRVGEALSADAVKVRGLDGWQSETNEAWLAQVQQAIEARAMSPMFVAEVAKQQARRILGDEADEAVMQEIGDEIDAAADGLAPGTGMGIYGMAAPTNDGATDGTGNQPPPDAGNASGGSPGGRAGRGGKRGAGRARSGAGKGAGATRDAAGGR